MNVRRIERAALLCAALGLLAPAAAQAQPGAVLPVSVEGSLSHFHAALRALERDPSRQVRVLHWGDSNVAADLWTQVARDTLQTRFGHGGSGYLLPRRHGSWHRGPVRIREDGPWQTRRRGFARDFGPVDGLWGLAGSSVEPIGPGARLLLDVPAADQPRCVEVHLLGRPQNGAVTVTIDDDAPVRIETRASAPSLILRRFRIDSGAHRVRVRAVVGRPRVLGVVVERPRGVVYDVFGINGARASAITGWDRTLLETQLAHRRPDLVVLSYGGNEALDPDLGLSSYEQQTRAAIQRIQALAPNASVLLVGPLATEPRYAARMGAVTSIQRRLARELGCAFWDSSLTSGGPGTLSRWVRLPGMVGRDHLHLGRVGYELVGHAFAAALLDGV